MVAALDVLVDEAERTPATPAIMIPTKPPTPQSRQGLNQQSARNRPGGGGLGRGDHSAALPVPPSVEVDPLLAGPATVDRLLALTPLVGAGGSAAEVGAPPKTWILLIRSRLSSSGDPDSEVGTTRRSGGRLAFRAHTSARRRWGCCCSRAGPSIPMGRNGRAWGMGGRCKGQSLNIMFT